MKIKGADKERVDPTRILWFHPRITFTYEAHVYTIHCGIEGASPFSVSDMDHYIIIRKLLDSIFKRQRDIRTYCHVFRVP
jgi:hypothetical protein